MNKENRLVKWLISTPPLLFLSLFFAAPSLIMVLTSFRLPGEFGGLAPISADRAPAGSEYGFTLETYQFFFSDILYFLPYVEAIGGLRILDAIHVIAAYFFLLYLVVHLYMATLGHSFFAHFKAMIVGYEEEPGPAPRHEA